MAVPTWSYGGWRRESGSTAQRDMLILHIEEVEELLSGYQSQSAQDQTGERYGLEKHLEMLEKKLAVYDDALGLTLKSKEPQFVQMRPRH